MNETNDTTANNGTNETNDTNVVTADALAKVMADISSHIETASGAACVIVVITSAVSALRDDLKRIIILGLENDVQTLAPVGLLDDAMDTTEALKTLTDDFPPLDTDIPYEEVSDRLEPILVRVGRACLRAKLILEVLEAINERREEEDADDTES